MRAMSRIPEEVDALKEMTRDFLWDVMSDLAYSNASPRREITDVFFRLICEEASQASYQLKEVAIGR